LILSEKEKLLGNKNWTKQLKVSLSIFVSNIATSKLHQWLPSFNISFIFFITLLKRFLSGAYELSYSNYSDFSNTFTLFDDFFIDLHEMFAICYFFIKADWRICSFYSFLTKQLWTFLRPNKSNLITPKKIKFTKRFDLYVSSAEYKK